MAKIDPNDETQRMAIMAWREEEEKLIESGELFRLIGIFQKADLTAAQERICALLALKKVHDNSLYKPFRSWERFCDLVHVDHRSMLEQFQNIQSLGLDLLQRALALDLPRETIRQVRLLNQPEMKELEAKVSAADNLTPKEAKELVRQALDMAVEARSEMKTRSEDLKKSAKRFEGEADKARAEAKDAKKKIDGLEKRVQALRAEQPEDMRFARLWFVAAHGIEQLKHYVEVHGILPEDKKLFGYAMRQLNNSLYEIKCRESGETFHCLSREEMIASEMKATGATREEAIALVDAAMRPDEEDKKDE